MILTALAVAGLAWSPSVEGQIKTIRFCFIVGVGVLAFGGWFLESTNIPRRLRLACLGFAALLLVGMLTSLKYDGIDGNFVPFFSWSWTPEASPQEWVSEESSISHLLRNRINLRQTTPQDWPQYLGPHRLGVVKDVHLSSNWEMGPPRIVWRQPIGEGMSSFSVVGDFAITQEQRGGQLYVACYEIDKGQPAWSYHVGPGYHRVQGDGPRSTPTIFDGYVYALGPQGALVRLDGSTGKPVWQVNVLEQAQADNLSEGIVCSPLIVDDLVVVSTGDQGSYALVAYDQNTGQTRWTAGEDHASFSSPTLMTLCGVEQIVVMNARSISGHSISDGRLLWDHPWGVGSYIVSQPLQIDPDSLLISSGQGVGTSLFEVECGVTGKPSLRPQWEDSRTLSLQPKFSTPIVKDGYVYGNSDPGLLVCLDLETGKACWKRRGYGHAQLILVGDLFLVMSEDGRLALLNMTPEELTELGNIQLFERRTWNIPTISGNRLLARNDREAVCVELNLEADSRQDRDLILKQ